MSAPHRSQKTAPAPPRLSPRRDRPARAPSSPRPASARRAVGLSSPLDRLVDIISGAHHLVVFTGAGVSTLSGIPDFRGRNGVYHDAAANRMFSIEGFAADPAFFYQHARDFIYNLHTRRPSIVHR